MQSDAELIQEFRSGRPDAFRLLVERYQTEAFGHALTILRHREDALDSVQDAFLSAYRAIEQFDVSREFYPWLYVILRNRCFKLFDARTRRNAVGSVSLDNCRLIAAPHNRDVDKLEDALAAATPRDREIILLKHIDGLTYAELAERLEIPIGTVMSRLFNARRRLKAILEEPDEVSVENRSQS